MSFSLRAKRVLIGAATGAMVLSLMPAGVAVADTAEVCENAPDAGFTDVFEGGTHTININCMAAYDVGQGRTDGSYGVFVNLTRGQAATLLVDFAMAATDGEIAGDIDGDKNVPFTDINGTTHENNIKALYRLGLIQGTTETTYSPNISITRVQFATILFNAHVALGVEFDEDYPNPFSDTNRAQAIALAGEGIVSGTTATTFSPFDNVLRGQTASLLAKSAGVLDDLGLWAADRLSAPVVPGAPNETFTVNPELVSVDRDGDIVTFTFDKNVPGKSLNLVDGNYTGLRLYDADGTLRLPDEANIDGNVVTARYSSANIVSGAARATVYTDTTRDATGRGSLAGDFPLTPRVGPAPVIGEYFPELVSVGNYSTTTVSPAEITVDWTIEFGASFVANDAEAKILDLNEAASKAVADEFALVGADGQIYRALDVEDADASGSQLTVTLNYGEALDEEGILSDVPQSELQRGFIEEDALVGLGVATEPAADVAPGDDARSFAYSHVLVSEAFQGRTGPNGVTTEPELVTVERGPGANQMRFVFDEAVNEAEIDASLFTVSNEDDDRATPNSAARSLLEADDARVVVATFAADDIAAAIGVDADGDVLDYASVGAYLRTVSIATVDTLWADGADTEVLTGAVRATNQIGSQQRGWNTPSEVPVTPVQPDVPADPTPGATDLADLLEVSKSQNVVTGNWSVTYTFDSRIQDSPDYDDNDVTFRLYDAAGTAFRVTVTNATGSSFTFGPNASPSDADGAVAGFSNEQIRASVVGTVEDTNADLGYLSGTDIPPAVTEGAFGLN